MSELETGCDSDCTCKTASKLCTDKLFCVCVLPLLLISSRDNYGMMK